MSQGVLLAYWTQSSAALAYRPPVAPPQTVAGLPLGAPLALPSSHGSEFKPSPETPTPRVPGQSNGVPGGGNLGQGHGDDYGEDEDCDDADADEHEANHHNGHPGSSCQQDLQDGRVPRVKVRKNELWPPNHRLVDVGLQVDLGEGCCGLASVSLRVFSDEPDNGTGDGDTPIDAQIAPPDLFLRQERKGNGDGRVYTIEATATYDGVSRTRCTTVVVPKSQSKKDRARVRQQACAARAVCGAAAGPPGFHLLTEGLLIGSNRAPSVNAGPDLGIDLGATAALLGNVSDDGLPGSSLEILWSQVDGPGTVIFNPQNAAHSSAAFSAPGTYHLRLTGDDGDRSSSDDVMVVVQMTNAAPVVSAGPDRAVTLPGTTVDLAGTASDDGLPRGVLNLTWSVISGPGTVVFGASDKAATSATLPAPGVYLLRLSASDGQFEASDDVKVVLFEEAPPVIQARDGSVEEGQEGDTGGLVLLSLSKSWPQPVSVEFITADGTAQASCDYRPRFGTVTFAPGQTEAAVLVPVVGERVPEGDESLKVLFGNPAGATLERTEAALVILQDDAANNAPAFAPARTPVDAATGVGAPVTLAWAAGDPDPGDSLRYDVELGTTFSTTGQLWTQACPATAGPSARAGAVFAYDEANDRLMVWGGAGSLDPDTLWILENASGAGQASRWTAIETLDGPSGLQRAAAAYDPSTNRLIVHGGCSGDCASAFGETWLLSHANGLASIPQWTLLSVSGPGPRVDAAAAYVPVANRLVLLGGSADPGGPVMGDLWVLKDANGLGAPGWESLTVPGGPGPRRSAVAAYDPGNDRLLLFGGQDGEGQARGDLWELRSVGGAAPEWHPLAAGEGPAPRWGHALAFDPGSRRLLVFGGTNEEPGAGPSFAFADTWLLRAEGSWVRVSSPALAPTPRFRAVSAYSPGANRLVVALGASSGLAGSTGPEDLWTLADAAGRLPAVSLSQSETTYLGDALDPGATHLWRVVVRDEGGAWRGSAVWSFAGNRAPLVDAGPDAQASVPHGVLALLGSVADDGLPATGALETEWSLASGPSPVAFADPGAPTTSVTFSQAGTYVLKLSATDSVLSASDTLQVEVTTNDAPEVDAGPDRATALPAAVVLLDGVVSDDGLSSPATLTIEWSQVAGPAPAALATPSQAGTSVAFSIPGTYGFRLSASDGVLSASDDVVVVVSPENQAPVVEAGPDQVLSPPQNVLSLVATATDDGLPTGSTLAIAWSKITGPGPVIFDSSSSLATVAHFGAAGVYVLRVSVSDGALSAADDLAVTVLPGNQAPVVAAGPDLVLPAPGSLSLLGAASDDGLPVGGGLTVTWALVQGSAAVIFGDPESASTAATLSAPGVYVLRLTASDSLLTTWDEATVAVASPGQSPDLTVTLVDVSALAVDPLTLTVSGLLAAQIQNGGVGPTAGPFTTLFFEDTDGNGAYGPGDTVLGSADVVGLDVGASATVTAAASSGVSFAGNLVFAFVDAGQVVAESQELNNLGSSAAACVYEPSASSWNPTVKWSWSPTTAPTYSHVFFSGVPVVDLDQDQSPEVVFTAHPTANITDYDGGVLRVIDGRDGSEKFTLDDPLHRVSGGSALAVGDLTGDGHLEIVAFASGRQKLTAFRHDGQFLWDSAPIQQSTFGSLSLADLDADGQVEIVVGRQVLNSDGTLRFTGTGGSGRNQTFGPHSIVVDLDLNLDAGPRPEVLAGNTAYYGSGPNAGQILWQNAALPDGFTAVANFDADPNPEIVLVASGQVWLLEHTGAVIWGPVDLQGGGAGSAPSIGDLDGDGAPEIVVMGTDRHTALESDGTILWSAPLTPVVGFVARDQVPKVLFDFDADGAAEVVTSDFRRIRIHRGTDGVILGEVPRSGPIGPVSIADVDGDGKAEIVDGDNGLFGGTGGVRAIHDSSDLWAPTRAIWNQVAYHITNVDDDGTLPIVEGALTLNSYRQQALFRVAGGVPVAGCPYAKADLVPSYFRAPSGGPARTLTVRVGNGGALQAGRGLPVSFYDGNPESGGALLGTAFTSATLAPGRYEDVGLDLPLTQTTDDAVWVVADDFGTLVGAVTESDEANNLLDSGLALRTASGADLVVANVDVSGVTGAWKDLTVSGVAQATLQNLGTVEAAASFEVSFFDDRDGDGALTPGVDEVLGVASVAALPPQASTTVTAPVVGSLPFRGRPLHALVDSGAVVPELDESNNVGVSGQACRQEVGSPYELAVERSWQTSTAAPTSTNVSASAVVIDLDGDGVADPVFVTFAGASFNSAGRLRAVSGRTGAVLFTNTTRDLRPLVGIGAGDLDLLPDGRPELLALSATGTAVLAFAHDGTFLWQSPPLEAVPYASLALADLDGDGHPEVLAGRHVLSWQGVLLWKASQADLGSNGSSGAASIAVDLDLDGFQEVIVGRTAYISHGPSAGAVLWTANAPDDGIVAAANLDRDPHPELVLVSGNEVRLLDHQGALVWGPVELPGTGFASTPTLADFDGDGQLEIGVGMRSLYSVVEGTGFLRWSAGTDQGTASNNRGLVAAAFDFDADGSAELVLADEASLRVLKGRDGATLASLPLETCAFGLPYPVVADADGDGNAEIVAVSNEACTGSARHGLFVVGEAHDRWATARAIWNQHDYHVANVGDDGKVPASAAPRTGKSNGARHNVSGPGSPRAGANITASYIRRTDEGTSLALTVRVGNGGAAIVPPGVPVSFFNGDPRLGFAFLAGTSTSQALLPGEYEDVSVSVSSSISADDPVHALADGDLSQTGMVAECDEDDNLVGSEILLNLAPTVDAGTDRALAPGVLTAALAGTASDDGLPLNQALHVTWFEVGEPGNPRVTFEDPHSLDTTAHFAGPGTHRLRLRVSDSARFTDDDVHITVVEGNQPPTVNAGPDQVVVLPDQAVTLVGSATDDGLPGGSSLSYAWSQVSGPGAISFDTPDASTTIVHLGVVGTYVLRLQASDGTLSALDQVTVFLDPVNQAPVVAAGPDRASAAATVLAGSVTDDGFPRGAALTLLWSVVSGPGTAHFANADAATTGVTFAADGEYTLRLTASDGGLTTFDDVVLHVNPPNQPPAVNAGPDAAITMPPTTSVTLSGTVTDDGVPFGSSVVVGWSELSGPAPVSFTSPGSLATSAIFGVPGTYVLRLTASDSVLTGLDDLTVMVTAGNLPPAVEAGPSQSLVLPAHSASLVGTVTDDGLPAGSVLGYSWSQVSGPGTATFTAPHSLSTTALLDAAGTYVLRLTVTDSNLNASDTVAVTVLPAAPVGPPPMVSLDSPAERARVTTPTEVVGTVASGALFQWKLELRATGDQGFTRIATGETEVTGGSLGVLDPTLLRNGVYEVRLTATDSASRSAQVSRFVVVRENQKVGHFTVSFVDLEVPVAGLPIRVTRTYDSRDKGKGDFGFGWRLDLSDVRLQQSSTTGLNWYATNFGIFTPYCLQALRPAIVTVTMPGGRVYEFEPVVTPSCQSFVPIQEATVSYKPLAPTRGTLQPLDGGQVVVTGSLGPVQLFGATDYKVYDPKRFLLTTEDGRIFQIDQSKGLERVTDLNGNQLNVTAGGVTSCPPGVSSGPTCKGIVFTRDAEGRIATIKDPAGNAQVYAYDPGGDLVTHTDREQNATHFTYESAFPHHLRDIQDPLGRKPIKNTYFPDGRLESHTDAFGKTIQYSHSLSARQEAVTDRTGAVRVLEYDIRGNVERETDPTGKVVVRTFDARNNRLTETEPYDPANPASTIPTTTFTYDLQDNLLSTTDPQGNPATYTYNARKQILTTQDANGNATINVYDPKGNLLTTTDAAGHVTSCAYDLRGNVLSQTVTVAGVAQTTSYTYDAFGNMTKEKDPLGHETTYSYDANGNRLSQTTARTTAGGPETLVTAYEYDRQGRLTKTTDPDGTETRTVYDALGRQIETRDKLGRVTVYEYDEMGRLVSTIHPDLTTDESTYDAEGRRLTSQDRGGRTTSYEFDSLGRLTKTIHPDSTFTENTYDAAGRLQATKDARGKVTTYEYDSAGRRTKVRDPLGNETVFSYDPNGNQKTVKDARQNVTTFEYDDLNRRVKTIFPPAESGATATFNTTTYDEVGRLTSETDQGGQVTSFSYDKLGRLIKVTDAMNGETVYGYDELGNRTLQRDANGHETRFEYDKQGRQVRRTLPDGKSETMAYDAAGNLETRTDFMGRVTTYAYDSTNRLTSRTYPNPSENVIFTYTPTGRRATATDSRGTTTYGYDLRDRLTSLIQPAAPPIGPGDGAAAVVGSLTMAYDGNGNRTSLTVTVGPTGSPGSPSYVTGYTYDDAGRLDVVTDPVGRSYDHGYDPNGNRSSLAHPNGVTTAYTYDNLNRLTNLAATRPSSGSTVFSQTLTLGPAGNRTQIVEHDGSVKAYTYDALYRLTGETVSGLFNYSKSFVYDAVGNRQSQTTVGGGAPGTPLAPGTINYAYDTRDRLTAEGVQAYDWDDNGNLITKDAEAIYVWDHESRLAEVTKTDGTVVEHLYDADGNRVQTRVTPAPLGGVPQPAVAVDYLVDTSGSLSHVVAEIDLSTPTPTLQAMYIRGDDLLSVMRPQVSAPAVAADWQARFYTSDSIGSIRRLTNEAGNITDGYTYSAFGELLAHSGTNPQPYAFAGEPLDPNSGFQYHRARWYAAGAGRFTGMDPFSGGVFDPGSLHRYMYASAQPCCLVDPSGLFTQAFGYAVEAAIEPLYRADHPADGVIFGRWNRVGANPRLKPDVLNYSRLQWIEIKPLSYSGVADATFKWGVYMAAFSPVGFYPDTEWEPADGLLSVGGVPVFVFNVGGILFYTDAVDLAEDAAALASIKVVTDTYRLLQSARLLGTYVAETARIGRLAALAAAGGQSRINAAIAPALIMASLGLP